MSGLGLTKIMIGHLIHMVENNGISYSDQRDRTMVALRERTLVTYRSRLGSYGKSHWTLTEFGTDTATRLLAKRRDGMKPRRKHVSERACPDDNCMPGHGGKCTACAGEQ